MIDPAIPNHVPCGKVSLALGKIRSPVLLGQLGQKIFQANSLHHIARTPELGGKIAKRLGGIEAHLGVDAAGTGGGIKLEWCAQY